MNVQLTKPELEKFVEEQVRTGNYSSPAEVIEAGLTHLMLDTEIESLGAETLRTLEERAARVKQGHFRDWKEASAELRQKYLGKP
jgi:Arc/MetJ-type ribon-helix-helix transcriptional regulator